MVAKSDLACVLHQLREYIAESIQRCLAPVLHSVSVDSESIGTKKSFRGQASSQSIAP
jgi:hypothetical protein